MPRKTDQSQYKSVIDCSNMSCIQDRMSRFSFKEYNSEQLWEDYITRFELTCRVKGLGGANTEEQAARRDLLLANIGEEHLRALSDQMYPRAWEECTYDEVKEEANRLFKPTRTLFATRFEFERAIRKDGETFILFYNRLKSLARSCKYGDSLDERVRDRFAVGSNCPEFEVEVRQRWPEGVDNRGERVKSTVVLELAQSMERAREEVSKHSCKNEIFKVSDSKENRKPEVQKSTGFNRCYRCGFTHDPSEDRCPAVSAVCKKCSKRGHFARMCKSKNNFVKRTDGNLRKVDDSCGLAYDDECSSDIDVSGTQIRSVKSKVPRATIDVELNGYNVRMEFDSGARVSAISLSLWDKINSSGESLKKTSDVITGYGKNKLEVMGKTFVDVTLRNRTKRLPVIVLLEDDVPLFGLPWSVAFNLNLPREVRVRRIDNGKTNSKETGKNEESYRKTLQKEVETLTQEFSELFRDELGTISDSNEVIHLKSGTKPVSFGARRVPFPLREAVERELQRLVQEGVLEAVDPSETPIEWSTPTVNVDKGGGRVRICGDFRTTLNPNIVPERHLLPTFDDLTSKLTDGKIFSVIDLRDAYLQMKVHPESQKYLTIATHVGYFRYKRLPFGLSSSPAKFQRYMESLLKGLNVGVLLDDIIISSKDKTTHITTLREVLRRLESSGIRAKLSKCKFFEKSVKYLGHTIDGNGIHPSEDKVETIRHAPRPRNVKELRAFLGALNFYERYIPNLHAIASNLHKLTGTKTKWKWTDTEQSTFDKLKNILSLEKTLVPYDISKPIIVECDACEQGVGAVLLHLMPDGTERPVMYASRTLTEAEKRYATVDKEALALVFAVKKFRQYLSGRHFKVRTDHKPLERIFGMHRDLTKVVNNRLVRWALYLMEYDFEIQYIKGQDNCLADFLSRFSLKTQEVYDPDEREIRALVQEKIDVVYPNHELVLEYKKDPNMKKLIDYLEHGWPKDTGNLPPSMKPYWNKREELTLENGIIMRLGRIVVPQILRENVLKELHKGHPGIEAMRSLSRYYVWWPNLNKDVEVYVRRCHPCQSNRSFDTEVPLYPWNVPSDPWERIHLDFAGPFDNRFWLVGIDAYSKWVEIEVMDRTTTAALVNRLRTWFSRYGVPKKIVSDNGTPFTSHEFKSFCKDNNICHVTSAPYHPKTNGLVERIIRTFKSRYSACKQEGLSSSLALLQVLLAYRNTPQKTTGQPPSVLFYGRRLPTALDRWRYNSRERIENQVWRQKYYHDLKSKQKEFSAKQEVWVQNETKKGWRPGTVQERTGELSYTVLVGGDIKRKHADQLRAREGATDPPQWKMQMEPENDDVHSFGNSA
ncbi:uncharacterized protein K02A2.6-like [Macrosteles quadrilineatus]|uniref:uncharacterized protein K02A2.6-like n=1 Tax=Macrosteles quadrilineatus TaxID=74068 RepID=UPI0023E11669|nr:uncharacterized protein K02A2.6-like [Macrosteles quadrilineatus]